MTFLEEVKKPFNLISLSLAAASIIFSFVFYFDGKKDKKISYQLVEPASLVFDSKNSSPKIKLLERDSVLINENVYLQTGTIWNNGDLPILKSDIRKKIVIKLKNSKRILDFKIIKQKDLSIANFSLQQEDEKSISVNWDYFDPSYGFIFQIIYIGNENPNFELQGKVLDVESFDFIKANKKEGKTAWIILAVVYALMGLFIISIIYRRRYNKQGFSKIYFIMLAITVLVLTYILFFKIFTNSTVPV